MIKNIFRPRTSALMLIGTYLVVGQTAAQFRDDFNQAAMTLDRKAITGWAFYTGEDWQP